MTYRDEKKQIFIKKMIEAWSVLLESNEKMDNENESLEITIEMVRKILLKKAKEGKALQIREILQSFHVEKLSDLEEKYYNELVQAVQKI